MTIFGQCHNVLNNNLVYKIVIAVNFIANGHRA